MNKETEKDDFPPYLCVALSAIVTHLLTIIVSCLSICGLSKEK